MNATSTLIYPQKVLIQVTLRPDTLGQCPSPAYFDMDTQKFMLNRKLIALEVFSQSDFPKSPLTPNIDVAPVNLWTNFTLTLLREPGNGVPGGDFYKGVPLQLFHRQLNSSSNLATAPDLWRCEPTEMSWGDCYVANGGGVNMGPSPLVIPFLATYLLPDQDPTPYCNIPLKRR